MNISAVIIAGGESRRLNGIKKSNIVINKLTVFDRQREVLQNLFPYFCTIANNSIRPEIVNFVDEYKNVGPIAGIYTALKHVSTEYIFAFSCDMPFLNADIVSEMIKQLEIYPVDVLVPKHKMGIEPLHAIYKKTLLPVIEQQIISGNYQIRAFFDKIKVVYFDIEEHGFSNECFFNINYPEDILKANEYASRFNN